MSEMWMQQSVTVVVCAADVDVPLHTARAACTCWGTPSQCSSSCRRWLSPRSYFCVSLTTRAAAFSSLYSLELVCGGLGGPSKNGAAVVHAWRHKSVDQRGRWFSVKWTSDSSELAKPVEAHRTDAGNVLVETQIRPTSASPQGHGLGHSLLFVEKMMWMGERVWPKMKSECCEEAKLWWGYADMKVGWLWELCR